MFEEEYMSREAIQETLAMIADQLKDDPHAVEIITQIALTFANYPEAADVAPVVHGRWEYKSISPITGYVWLCCSECKETMLIGRSDRFCPNCGAKMDGKEEQERGGNQ